MRWLARCAASLALSAALVLTGFCAGAGQGARAGHDVQQAYAVGEVQAARAFATLLGSMGFSVGAYALKNSVSFDTAADNLYVDFNNSADVDPIRGIVTSAVSSLVASPAGVAFVNLGLTVDAIKGIAQWMLDGGYLDSSVLTYSPVAISGASFSLPVLDRSLSNTSWTYLYTMKYQWSSDSSDAYFYINYPNPNASYTVTWAYNSSFKAYGYKFEPVKSSFSGGEVKAFNPETNSQYNFGSNVYNSFWILDFPNISVSSLLAYSVDSSYSPDVSSGVAVPSDTALSGAPANIGSSSTASDAQAFADAVSTNLADKTLVANGTTVNNYTYGDIVTDGTSASPADNILDWLRENLGALQGTLEGVLEGIQAGTLEIVDAVSAVPATVMEGVTTFFDPLVKLFSPPDVSNDDIGDMIVSNANGSHTFTQHFPFCVLNDYMSAFESLAVTQGSRAALNYTPSRFVITLPAAGYSGGKEVKLDFTHYFSDEFYGFTLGRFSQLVLSLCTFLGVLSFVARLVGIAEVPDMPVATYESDGGTASVYEDEGGQTRLF